MRIALAVLLTIASTIVAQADQPAAPTTPSSTTPAPSTAAAAPAPADPKAQLEAKKTEAMDALKKNGFSGYKTKIAKDGNAVYCRKEQQIGTRFETETCRSLDALIQQRESAKNYMNTLQQQGLEGRPSN
ncbi:MAG TPA: hypothetical protein VGI93_03890 [Steroidobacteraceae bacterium]|jgi:hypothetical protein